jgi:hypothetical protein
MTVFGRLLFSTFYLLYSVYSQWAQPVKNPGDLHDIKAIMARAKEPVKFKMEVRNYHLVDCSTPTRFVTLRTAMAPGTVDCTIKLKKQILLTYKQRFCLSNALGKELSFFDIVVGDVRFQNTQGLIVLVGKYPWDYEAEPQHFFLDTTSKLKHH